MHLDTERQTDDCESVQSSDVLTESIEESQTTPVFAQGGRSLPTSKFLAIDQLVDILTDNTPTLLTHAPRGVKEDSYFTVDNTRNVQRNKSKLNGDFWDDCGSWGPNGSLSKTLFLKQNDDSISNIFDKTKQGLGYCKASKVNGKIKHVPLTPQPDVSCILPVRRYYTSLKACPTYKRRVTWIDSELTPPVAVFEYIGSFPGQMPHGNTIAKQNVCTYTRTITKTMDKIRQGVM